MKKISISNHKLNTADIITMLRIAGAMLLVFLRPLSAGFLSVYTITGLTDVLDGWIARRTKAASDFGAKLDSIADLLFFAVMLTSGIKLKGFFRYAFLFDKVAVVDSKAVGGCDKFRFAGVERAADKQCVLHHNPVPERFVYTCTLIIQTLVFQLLNALTIQLRLSDDMLDK